MRGRLLLSVLLCLHMTGIAHAQLPEPTPGRADAGVLTEGSLHHGKQVVGVCGEDGYFAPYGKGVGFLQPHKSWQWRLTGSVTMLGSVGSLGFGVFDLCGRADVPAASVSELGTAGACDASRGTNGVGRFHVTDAITRVEREYRVAEVGWPATGSVMVVTGTVPGGADLVPGALLMLLQRRTSGFCMHKDSDVPAVGTRYPQGGSYADVAGVLVLTTPRDAVQAPGCEPWWGQVRRHLGGLGAGLHCPVPEGPVA